MNKKIILRLKELISYAEQKDAKSTVDKIAKNYKLIGLYEALNAVYEIINE